MKLHQKRSFHLARQDQGAKLQRYREEMRDLTNSILDLVSARQKLSLKIARAKTAQGLEVEDRQVERRLISSVKEHAAKIGLEEEIAESLARKLIESSKIAQRRDTHLKQIRYFLKKRKISRISIIGAGRMGRWFASYFLTLGAEVVLYDEDRSRTLNAAKKLGCSKAKSFSDIANSDLVILAVPISSTPGILSRLLSHPPSERKIRIIEVSSVKSEMARSGLLDMKRIPQSFELYSIHPLFGSNANLFSANQIVQVNRLDSDFIVKLFPHFNLFKMDSKKHDELMGLMLSLPHSLALVFAELTVRKAGDIPKGMGTPSYDYMLDLAKKVLGESPGVYFEIQYTNPNSKKIIDEAVKSLKRFNTLTEKKSRFARFFEETNHVI